MSDGVLKSFHSLVSEYVLCMLSQFVNAISLVVDPICVPCQKSHNLNLVLAYKAPFWRKKTLGINDSKKRRDSVHK